MSKIMTINLPLYILIPLFAINFIAFLVMLVDKIKSTSSGANRVPEIFLFFLALIFGGVGIYIGMFVFRHKTRKWSFKIGIPLLVILNLVILYLLLVN